MNEELQKIQEQVKENITVLVANGKLQEAQQLLNQYKDMAQNDIEIFSIQAVIYIHTGQLIKAQEAIKIGLKTDRSNFDLLYNLAYTFELQERYTDSALAYLQLTDAVRYNEQQQALVKEALVRIKKYSPNITLRREKIIFFVKPNMDSFIGHIIDELSGQYETKKVIVTNQNQIDKGMKWADICWFEWCDELIIYASQQKNAKNKRIICRLHSYEAFSEYPSLVNWDVVDDVIFVAKHIQTIVLDEVKSLAMEKTVVIPNGIDLKEYTLKEHTPGFKVAYVGYINYKKGPMLLLHAFKAIHDYDNRYKLYIAGAFQDSRYVLYFQQMIKEMNLENSVIYQGWQDDLNEWMEDKNYILCTSVLESQNMSVMQAMAKGIKPLIHNFVGAREIYPSQYIWNTIDQCVTLLLEASYDSKDYNNFIAEQYSINKQIDSIKELLARKSEQPLVTIGITVYNGKPYMIECIESFLNQTYSNVEILLIDDCSTDGSKEIIQKYEKKYENISAIYHSENSGGVSKGLQELIEFSRGKYFQWIACDDFVASDAVEEFVRYLENNPTKDYAYSNLTIVNENSDRTGEWDYQVPSKDELVRHIFNTGSGLIPMNCMYRKSFFETNNINWILYKGNDFSADTLNSLHFVKNNFSYGKIIKSVVNYRIHSTNTSHNLEKRIKTLATIFDYIINNFSEEIYFPNTNWKKVKNKEQLKSYLLAQFYFILIQNHISMKVIPGYLRITSTANEIGQYCMIFAEQGRKYVRDGLHQGNTYNKELILMQQKYQDYFEKFSK